MAAVRPYICDLCGATMASYWRKSGSESYYYDLRADLIGFKIRPYSAQLHWPPEAKRDFCLKCVKELIAKAEAVA